MPSSIASTSGVHRVLVQHRQAPVLGDPLDVVVVRRLVDERPDREARHRRHAQTSERGELHGDERAESAHGSAQQEVADGLRDPVDHLVGQARIAADPERRLGDAVGVVERAGHAVLEPW